MSNTGLNTNKVFREQVEINILVTIRKVSRKENVRVLSLLMIYKNKKSINFKVLDSVVYCMMENYIYLDYLCLQQARMYLAKKDLKTQH